MKPRRTPPPENPDKTSGERHRFAQPAQQTEPVDNLGVHRGQNGEKGDTERPENVEDPQTKRQEGVHH
jgi:hypothetical protein